MDTEPKVEAKADVPLTYIPSLKEINAQNEVIKAFTKAQSIIEKSYNQFNGNTLYDVIDDATKRWNGYIPAMNPLTDQQSNIFLNFTRKQIVTFLANAALQPPKSKIDAVNKKTGLHNKRLAQLLGDLNKFSLLQENGDARFLEVAMETRTKGTTLVYEGYCRSVQKDYESPGEEFDIETGKGKTKKAPKILYDDCFQRIHPIEDFYILNPYEPDVQKQPKIIPRQITSYGEAKLQYGKYKNWQYVRPGAYSVVSNATTFYRNKLATDLAEDQVEILPFYDKPNNHHIVMVNGVILYDGVIPFKNGKYPYSKYINQPYGNDFFWGVPEPVIFQGEQDEINTLWNLMTDKTFGSLLPMALSSDPDDMIEDDYLEMNKIRKVGDVEKWKWIQMPGVTPGEMGMLQQAIGLAKENSSDPTGGANSMTPRGGKLPAKQLLMKQQEAMKMMGFSMNYLEDGDRDRTELRISHIMQFYSIPRIETVTGVDGKSFKDLVYRDVRLSEIKLENGKNGTRIVKLIGDEYKNPDDREKIANDLTMLEEQGDISGNPVEAVAISVDTFTDFNYKVQVIKNSSFQRNSALEQAMRTEYAEWRLSHLQFAPLDPKKLIDWVDESYDVDPDQFKFDNPQQEQQMMAAMSGGPGGPGGPGAPQSKNPVSGKQPGGGPIKQLAPSRSVKQAVQ